MTTEAAATTARRWEVPHATLPTTKAIQKAANLLMQYGHHELTAWAIARAVPDPASLRSALANPINRQVEGGTLVMVRTSVWAAAIAPSPTNYRLLPHLTYPFGATETGSHRAPLANPTEFSEGFGLEVAVESPEELSSHLAAMAMVLLEENPLEISNGVRAPVSVVPTVVTHDDGTPQIAFLAGADGSCRIVGVHEAHGYRPADILYGFAGQDRSYRVLRSFIGDVLELEDRDREALSENDRTRVRTVTVPAELIVGFVPGAEDADLPSAVNSLVGQAHVDGPRAWAPAAQLDAQVDVAATWLARAGKISDDEAQYLRAMVPADEALAAGLPIELDSRAIRCFVWLTTRNHAIAVHRGLRTLHITNGDDPGSIGKDIRVKVGVEAAFRPWRSRVSRQAAESARTALREAWTMDEIADHSSWQPTTVSAEELLDAALDEHEQGTIGPASREILARASWWLAVHGVIRPVTRGGDPDRRALSAVLREVIRRRVGLFQLYQAIVDGREGIVPRRIKEDGRPVVTDDGRFLQITDAWLRSEYPSRSDKEVAREEAAGIDTPPPSPDEQLMDRRERLREAVRAMSTALADLEIPTDDSGRPFVHTVGLPPTVVEEMTAALTHATGKLALYGEFWTNARPATVGGDTDEGDADEEVEAE